jgi:hypothetical protein
MEVNLRSEKEDKFKSGGTAGLSWFPPKNCVRLPRPMPLLPGSLAVQAHGIARERDVGIAPGGGEG